MKILSKWKDYYDFVVTNPDSIVTYERQTKLIVSQSSMDTLVSRNELSEIKRCIVINNSIIKKLKWSRHGRTNFWAYKNNSLDNFGDFIVLAFCDKLYYIFKTKKNQYILTAEDFLNKFKKFNLSQKYVEEQFILTENNKNNILLNCPIVIYDVINNNITLNPKLSDYGFQKLFTPTQCYQELYNWFSLHKKQPDIPSSPDDMNRYEAKGFDKKTSFRNIK